MKNRLPFIILSLLFLSIGISESKCQKLSLIGKWEIKEVDSCTKVVRPGAEIKKYKLNNVTGLLTFNPNGLGTLESNTGMLCNHPEFYWFQKSDTIIISPNPITNRIVDYQRIISLNQHSVIIKNVFGCQRFGLGIWYDVLLEKKE